MGYRLKSINSKNFMKLPDGEYDLFGEVGFINGRNSQGKSSLLHVIQYVLGTKIGVGITNPIRVQEDKAKIVATFQHTSGDEYSLVIEFGRKEDKTVSKSYIVTKEGAKIKTKKAILDFLGHPPSVVDIGQVAKNQNTAAGQLRNLKDLFQPVMGINVEEQVNLLQDTKAANAELRKQIKHIEGMFSTHNLSPDEATEEKQPESTQEVADKYEEVRRAKLAYDEALVYVSTWEQKQKQLVIMAENAKHVMEADIDDRKKSVVEEIKELKKKIAEYEAMTFDPDPTLRRKHEDCAKILVEATERYAKSERIVASGEPDLDSADKALQEVHERNARVKLINTMVVHAKDLVAKRADLAIGAQTETEIIGAINDAISAARDRVNLPERFLIEVNDEGTVGIFYKDPDTEAVVPFNELQVAKSQMMLGSLALTLASFEASDTELKMVTLPDASLMDRRSMLAAIELAEEYNFSIYPEIVTEDDGVSVTVHETYQDAKAALGATK